RDVLEGRQHQRLPRSGRSRHSSFSSDLGTQSSPPSASAGGATSGVASTEPDATLEAVARAGFGVSGRVPTSSLFAPWSYGPASVSSAWPMVGSSAASDSTAALRAAATVTDTLRT